MIAPAHSALDLKKNLLNFYITHPFPLT